VGKWIGRFMKYWKPAADEHIVYEALTAIADERIEIKNGIAKCFSSSRNKFYTIKFDTKELLFMSDDNMAYYKDEISYPMLAVLLKEKVIDFDKNILPHFKNIPWKDINQKNKNDYMKSVREFLENTPPNLPLARGGIEQECSRIFNELNKLKLKVWGEKVLPPQKY
jgi:hypothetical protein